MIGDIWIRKPDNHSDISYNFVSLNKIIFLSNPVDKEFIKRINHLKKLVEARANLPIKESLKQRDFEILIDLIHSETKIRLSLSTLKRIWKPDYSGIPHPATLDALAQYAGYNNWHAFATSEAAAGTTSQAGSEVYERDAPGGRVRRVRLKWITAAMVVIAVAIAAWVILSGRPPRISLSDDYIVIDTLPAQVKLAIDIKGRVKDSLFLIPTQRPLKKIHVDRKADHVLFPYKTPGFFDVYLEYSNKIIDSCQVLVRTKGWVAAVYSYNSMKGASIESYFSAEKISNEGNVHIPRQRFEERGISIDGNLFTLYYYVTDPFKMDYDNFILEARVKSDSVYNFPIPYYYISLVTRNGLEFIPFTHKQTDRDHAISFNDSFLEGQTNDLSSLVADLYEWNDISIENHNRNIKILINGRESLSFTYKKPMKPIYGINFTFLGSGSIEKVCLADTLKRLIYKVIW